MTARDPDKSRAALMEILTGIVEHADRQAAERCPYRNRFDECTAKFSCRNQRPPVDDGEADQCGHDGNFDYRAAWDTKPALYDKAKVDIEKAKSRGRRRRRRGGRQAMAVPEPGAALFDLADARGIRLASSCSRLGNCHECIVEVTNGNGGTRAPHRGRGLPEGQFSSGLPSGDA